MHETELRQETPGKMQDFLSLFIRLLLYTVFLLVISHFCADFNTGSRNFHGFFYRTGTISIQYPSGSSIK